MSDLDPYRLLKTITGPADLRKLDDSQLVALAEEMRARIAEVVSTNGGHLASNLGVCEMTIAMHIAFNFEYDRLLWDVGHQCYPHKLITGRADRFDTLRQEGGISGFPAPSESEYDVFATGHAGTAISTAVGLAKGADLAGETDRKIVAVVGDASIVNGLSMEALNTAAMLKRQLLIVLNDNSMAIDKTQGSLARWMDRLRMTHTYSDVKHSTEYMLQRVPLGGEITDALRHLRDGLKTSIHGGQFFEGLGLAYFGPFDGHNIPELVGALNRLKDLDHPVVLHLRTQKGRGRDYAVDDPTRFHSPSAHTIEDGKAVFPVHGNQTWTDTFTDALIDAATRDDRVVALTAAMPDGTGLIRFRETFPERTIDVGIAESHAVGMAAGLAKAGHKPVVAVYSTFMQRAIDQVFHEAALQNLPVVVCMDRAGLVGSDGAVHHGFMDIAAFRTLPNMTVLAPATGQEMPLAMDYALSLDGPSAIRYPRDYVPECSCEAPAFETGKSVLVREGTDGALLCFGTTLAPAIAAAEALSAEGKHVAVVNARFAKPLDLDMVREAYARGPVVTLEEHAISGGFGSAVLEAAATLKLDASRTRVLGIPDAFIPHGGRSDQLAGISLDPTGIAAAFKAL
jgi:1-deoxy-D-xylulose-5-phosphate synthase